MTYCFGLYGAVLLAAVALSGGAMAQTPAAPSPALQPLGIGLEGIDYPYPVHHLDLTIEGQPLRMAYMDVAPAAPPNDKTVVLLHGKSFSGDYWAHTIATLTGQGYRVVVPDQIGLRQIVEARHPLSFRSPRPQHQDAARQPRSDPRGDRRPFLRRHALSLFRARLSGDDGSAGAGEPDRP